ncbi:MAG: UTP--glucose-1-phosphate uridylyltransferase [Planctomycetota bacterium]
MTNSREHDLRARAGALGQDHLFQGWQHRSESERSTLFSDLESLDWDLMPSLLEFARGEAKPELPSNPEPVDAIAVPRTPEECRREQEVRARGETEIRAGATALLMVAGGQGTRLGYDGPKGTFRITPVLDRPIFALHAERIGALEKRHGVELHWVIMTSPANDASTRADFEANGFYGRPASRVRFMVQGMLPAADFQGRLLLASPGRLALSPNGHGGALDALRRSGIASDLLAKGVKHVYSFQVDNVIVPAADPILLGHHVAGMARISTKCVQKRDPAEPVGVAARWGGGFGIIEYSDLPDALRHAKDAAGLLKFRHGSIATHWIDLSWAAGIGTAAKPLPFHLAKKKVPCWSPEAGSVTPEKPNAFKFEMFLFDALRHAERAVFQEVDRHAEFSPVKNLTGDDSADTARADLSRIWSEWLREGGIVAPPGTLAEVSPSFALDAEECARKLLPWARGHRDPIRELAAGAFPGIALRLPRA